MTGRLFSGLMYSYVVFLSLPMLAQTIWFIIILFLLFKRSKLIFSVLVLILVCIDIEGTRLALISKELDSVPTIALISKELDSVPKYHTLKPT